MTPDSIRECLEEIAQSVANGDKTHTKYWLVELTQELVKGGHIEVES